VLDGFRIEVFVVGFEKAEDLHYRRVVKEAVWSVSVIYPQGWDGLLDTKGVRNGDVLDQKTLGHVCVPVL
jgi:hypothetical protein